MQVSKEENVFFNMEKIHSSQALDDTSTAKLNMLRHISSHKYQWVQTSEICANKLSQLPEKAGILIWLFKVLSYV